MIRSLAIHFFVFISLHSLAGFTRRADSSYFIVFADRLSGYAIEINGKEIPISEDTFLLPINYPLFDTVKIIDEQNKCSGTFLKYFQPGERYAFILRNEKSGIYPKEDSHHHSTYIAISKGNSDHWDEEFFKILNPPDTTSSEEKTGNVVVKIKNKKDTLALGFVYAIGHSNTAKGVVFRKNGRFKIPSGDLFSTLDLAFGNGAVRTENTLYNDLRFLNFYIDDKHYFVFDEEPEVMKFSFTNKETLIIIYDCKTNKITLKTK